MEFQNSIDILIIRLFSGEANPDEKKIISEWLALSAENKKLYNDLREIWLSAGIETNADHYDLEAAVHKFRNQISKAKQEKQRLLNLTNLVKYAAIFILGLIIPISYFLETQNTEKQAMTTISCAFGDKTAIVLPDGSKVWLNSGSKLKFNSDFRNTGRSVILDGEAFFSVAKDKSHPFRVKASEIEVEVLGTLFNVKAYSEENSISTTLVEGSLRINDQSQSILIRPNQKVIFNKNNKKLILSDLLDTSAETEWKEGRLIFRNESLEELEPKLERWFDVDIVFADNQVKNRRFTGILERESILEVVSYFDLSKYVSCQIEGNKVIIKTKTKSTAKMSKS